MNLQNELVKKYKIDDIICIDETSIKSLQKRKFCYSRKGKRCVVKTHSQEVFKKYTGIFSISTKGVLGWKLYDKGGINRYNEEINVVSGLHCQKDEGYTFSVISLHSEKELQELGCVSSEPTTKGGKKMTKKRAYTKKRGSKYKKMTKKPSKRSTKKRTPYEKNAHQNHQKRGDVKKGEKKNYYTF